MKRWLTRWLGIPTHYEATLTFLPDGTVILGLPSNTTERTVHEIGVALKEWNDSGRGRPIVFPWPIDVRDLRQPSFGQQYQ